MSPAAIKAFMANLRFSPQGRTLLTARREAIATANESGVTIVVGWTQRDDGDKEYGWCPVGAATLLILDPVETVQPDDPDDGPERSDSPYGVGPDEDEPHDHAYNNDDRADRYGRREP